MQMPVTTARQATRAPEQVSRVLSEFLAAIQYADIPEPVVARTEDLFLDWFGSALAGSHRWRQQADRSDPGTDLGSGRHTTVLG